MLIVHGTSDANLGVHHAQRLRDVRAARPTELRLLDGLSHMCKRQPQGLTGAEAFGYPGPTDERVADAVVAWLGGLKSSR